MKVVTFSGFTEKGLSNKINNFLASHDVEIIDIKYSASIFYMGALVIYKRKEKRKIES